MPSTPRLLSHGAFEKNMAGNAANRCAAIGPMPGSDGRLSRARIAPTCTEPLHPSRSLVRAAVSWTYARVTRVIARSSTLKTAPMEIPHLRTSRRIRSGLNPLALYSTSPMHGLERFACGLRPSCVSRPRVRIFHHRFYTDALSILFPAFPAIAAPSREISLTRGDLTSISRRIYQRRAIIAQCIHTCIASISSLRST
jgi:hypothetical protein